MQIMQNKNQKDKNTSQPKHHPTVPKKWTTHKTSVLQEKQKLIFKKLFSLL
jgi:hypothetical protein